jgi:hypothetical protein
LIQGIKVESTLVLPSKEKVRKMNASDINLFAEQIIRDAAFGLSFLAMILVINSVVFIRIFLWFISALKKLVNPTSSTLIFHFVSAVLIMSLIQLGSILIWTVALYSTGLIADIRLALLFSGSCYTTLGMFSDILPKGWQSVAFYISFSGLFSFAIATSSMISMLGVITKKVLSARTPKTLN